jgi:hypothetical protein
LFGGGSGSYPCQSTGTVMRGSMIFVGSPFHASLGSFFLDPFFYTDR